MYINAKAMPTNHTDYSWHIEQLYKLLNQLYGVYIKSLIALGMNIHTVLPWITAGLV